VNPYLFIVGCPRSGTTLLQRLLDCHEQLAITPETHWIPRWFHANQGKGITPDGRVSKKLLRKLSAHPRFVEMGVSPRKEHFRVKGKGRVSYARFVSSLFDLYGEQQGKPLVGDKTPGYAREVATLHELWPTAKFVHLIRDGRDVALSIINWPRARNWTAGEGAARFRTWTEDPLLTAALWWEWHVRLACEAGDALGTALYHEVHYEALVDSPEEECRTVCDFLGIAPDDDLLPKYEAKVKSDSNRDDKHPWMAITRGLRNWQSQLPVSEVERFEAAAGGLIEELDYRRALPSPQKCALEAAVRARCSFVQDALAQGYPVPASWQAVGRETRVDLAAIHAHTADREQTP
jgi:hypothetical protein